MGTVRAITIPRAKLVRLEKAWSMRPQPARPATGRARRAVIANSPRNPVIRRIIFEALGATHACAAHGPAATEDPWRSRTTGAFCVRAHIRYACLHSSIRHA